METQIIKKGAYLYPNLLAEIHDPPGRLYCRGNVELLNSPCLAVVGSRKITDYGRRAVGHFVPELASQGFTIVSGLALGVDAAAHEATLSSGGRTIAVLAGGVGDADIYPRSNYHLAKKIIRGGGLIVSECPNGTKPAKYMFPARNRIISGLSQGVLVVEADEKSGALITADFAVNEGRDVFAVPGSIFSPRSSGPNKLIRLGAKSVASPSDILIEYGVEIASRKPALSTANPDERAILEILIKKEVVGLDELANDLPNQSTSVILSHLSEFELKGLIKRRSDGKYIYIV